MLAIALLGACETTHDKDTGTPSPTESASETASDSGPHTDSEPPDTSETGEESGVIDTDGDGFDASVDCDDGDARVYPGAEEVCGDGVVNDCAGAADECRRVGASSTADSDAVLYGATQSDMLGYAANTLMLPDIDGDGADELVLGVATEYDAGYRGGIYFSFGGAEEVSSGALGIDVSLTSDGYYRHGWYLDHGDFDGDGVSDVSTYLAYGPDGSPYANGFVSAPASRGELPLEDYLHSIGSDWDHPMVGAGFAIRNTGGPMDALAMIGWSFQDLSYPALGVCLNPAAIDSWLDAEVWVWGTETHRDIATARDVGDLDGDGLDAVAVFVTGIPAGDGTYTGAVLVFDRVPSDGQTLEDADRVVWGDGERHDSSGMLIHPGGDVDGDGLGDLLLAYQDEVVAGVNDAGCARPISGPLAAEQSILDSVSAFCGADADDGAARTATGGSDIDGDGVADLAVGESEVGVEWAGGVSVFYGPLPAGTHLTDAADLRVIGAADMEQARVPVGGGDFDGDGVDDLVVGAYNNSEVASAAGAAYLFRGWSP